jgi:glycosyltransferase involved in cell wall biosynthesis
MKSIFLINPISGRGHLDAYARLYSRAFVELGYRVVLIAETDADAPDYLLRTGVGQAELFSFISFAEATAAKAEAPDSTIDEFNARSNMSAVRRAQLVWQEEGTVGIFLRCVIVPRRMARVLVPESIRFFLFKLRRKLLLQLSLIPAVRALRKLLYPDIGRIPFRPMLQYVQKACLILKEAPPNLVVLLYLDLMAEEPRNVAALDGADATPWAGILFHPRLAKSPQLAPEPYFKSRNARGGIFLVPAAIEIYAKIAPHLKFALVPDVADLEFTADTPPVAQEIRSRANGRKIILQVGTIAPHKGITTLLDVIAKADKTCFFFAFVGEVHWPSFGADEKRLRAFYAQPPENVYVHEGYLAEERVYNALIRACDVIYAVYSGFNSSSNSLTKSAGLRRPILVAKNTLMGDRVLASGIGLVASEGDASAILTALNELTTRSPDSFGFDNFVREHSLQRLKSVLAEALPQWLREPVEG